MRYSDQDLQQALKTEHAAAVDYRVAQQQRQENDALRDKINREDTGDYREHRLQENQEIDRNYFAPEERKTEARYVAAREKREEIENAIKADKKAELTEEMSNSLSL